MIPTTTGRSRSALRGAGEGVVMPKVVDHGQRRQELVEATWRIIARHGLSGATMRQIAAEAGFANGALKPYFPTKAELVEATYAFVFDRTNRRVEVAKAQMVDQAHRVGARDAILEQRGDVDHRADDVLVARLHHLCHAAAAQGQFNGRSLRD